MLFLFYHFDCRKMFFQCFFKFFKFRIYFKFLWLRRFHLFCYQFLGQLFLHLFHCFKTFFVYKFFYGVFFFQFIQNVKNIINNVDFFFIFCFTFIKIFFRKNIPLFCNFIYFKKSHHETTPIS